MRRVRRRRRVRVAQLRTATAAAVGAGEGPAAPLRARPHRSQTRPEASSSAVSARPALHADRGGLVRLQRGDRVEELRRAGDRRPGDLEDDVARAHAAFARRTVLDDAGDEDALLDREVERLGDVGRQVARLDADPAARDAAFPDQALHHLGRDRPGDLAAEAALAALEHHGDRDLRVVRRREADEPRPIDPSVGVDLGRARLARERLAADGPHTSRSGRHRTGCRWQARRRRPAGGRRRRSDDRQLVEIDLEDRDVRLGVGADRRRAPVRPSPSDTSMSSAPSMTWLLVSR